jgi:hypothetical protein
VELRFLGRAHGNAPLQPAILDLCVHGSPTWEKGLGDEGSSGSRSSLSSYDISAH